MERQAQWIAIMLFLLALIGLGSVIDDASASADPGSQQCDVYNRTCFPQYCYGTGGWTSPYHGYCPDTLGPPYGRGD